MYSIKNPEKFRQNIRKKINEKLFSYIENCRKVEEQESIKRSIDLSTIHSDKRKASPERNVGEDQFSVACEGKSTIDFDSVKSLINTQVIQKSDDSHNTPKENEEDIDFISTNLEKGIFNYSIKEANKRMIIKKWENTKFTQLYTDRLRTIYLNLNNNDFIEKIITMKIKPSEYTEITHQDISPEKWKPLIEQNNKKEESLLSVNIKANTDLYTCRKCKSRNIYFTETQTRSADEQSTITLLCLTCGKRWTHG
jgi:DNA-directed RNA polymerase subunit M/transcription elongation factor TFIIS